MAAGGGHYVATDELYSWRNGRVETSGRRTGPLVGVESHMCSTRGE